MLNVISVGVFCLVSGLVAGFLLSADFHRRHFAKEWLERTRQD